MRISIRTKIFAISLVLLLFLSAIGAFSLYRLEAVSVELQQVSDSNLRVLKALGGITTTIHHEEILYLETINDLDQGDLDADGLNEVVERLKRDEALVIAAMQRALVIVKGSEEAFRDEGVKVLPHQLQAGIEKIEKEHDDYFHRILKVLALYAPGEEEKADTLKQEARTERTEFLLQVESLMVVVEDLIESSALNAEVHQNEARIWTWVLIGSAALVGVLAALFVSSGLVKPLFRLVEGAREVEHGNLDVDIVVTSRDEVGTLADSFNEMTQGLRIKERIKETFGKYLDPRIVSDLISDSSTLSQSGQEELVTVFFSDIKGFTTIGEKLSPTDLVSMLNEYLTLMSDSIKDNRGVIDKYIGDAIMAFWGAPFSDPKKQADSACHAALNNMERLPNFRKTLPSKNGMADEQAEFTIRIGLATGKVIVGSIGSSDTKSYTIIGDTVNLAARLESLNKQYGTSILMTEDTRDMLGEPFLCREIDRIVVMGKKDPVSIHELHGTEAGATTLDQELCAAFANALETYRSGNWSAAAAAFQSCLAIKPTDGPSRVFLERVNTFQEQPPGDDWNGVWIATKK